MECAQTKMQNPPPDADRLIQHVLADLGWETDAATIADRVRRLDVGLPCEDEFAVICGWLGRCRLLHKLDQQQIPMASRKEFQVPDLLALFGAPGLGRPVLIEVKSNKGNKLSFTSDYLQRLTSYADLLKLPLLIAWKFHGIWTLFEAKHLKKAVTNFNISFSDAMKESLLGVLAGDIAYKIGAGAGVHLRFRKDKLLTEETIDDVRTEQWRMTVDDVSFTDYEGMRREDLDNEVQSLFGTWDLEEREEHDPSHVHLRFIAGQEGVQFSHMALVHLLNWESPKTSRPQWRALLKREQVTTSVASFSEALNMAMRQKIVSHIFHLRPRTMPDFVSSAS